MDTSASFSFGAWLKRRRSALLLSRDELARQVGCAVVTLRKIEADERRPSPQVAETAEKAYRLWYDLLPQGGAYAANELCTDVE